MSTAFLGLRVTRRSGTSRGQPSGLLMPPALRSAGPGSRPFTRFLPGVTAREPLTLRAGTCPGLARAPAARPRGVGAHAQSPLG